MHNTAHTRQSPTMVELGRFGDDKGWLSFVENGTTLPFDIKRVFFIYATAIDVVRGCHAHYRVWQLLVSVAGSCRVRVSNGVEQFEFQLDKPQHGLLLPPTVWREMDSFSDDCVLLVLASESYDPADYIRDRSEWLRLGMGGQ